MRGRKERLEPQLAAARRRIAELEHELEARTLRDPLTGLPTLQAFGRRLDVEVERSRRHGRSLSTAVLDVDGFQAVNASHGRELADELLKAVAATLSEFTRATDLVTRSSADEFVVAMPETSGPEAMQAIERIMLELEAVRLGPVECVSVSVGIAQYERPMSSSGLLAAARERLQRARAAGGGRAELERPLGGAHGGGDANGGAVAGLAEALNERDRYTGEHSGEVLQLVEQVARGLALDEQEVERVRHAALLHDIGKVAIPDEILNKPGPLNEEELEVMKSHTIIGERILRAIPGLGGVARIVRHEHERYDGTGYPDGLSGEEIPIGARIILACDAYHAMVSDRPYRRAMSHSDAIRQLGVNAGTQFDPAVTEVLIGCLYGSRQNGLVAVAA